MAADGSLAAVQGVEAGFDNQGQYKYGEAHVVFSFDGASGRRAWDALCALPRLFRS